MNALILAAGYASRLLPLTRDRPKALLEVGGRPILARLLDRVLALERVSSVCIVSNHRFAPLFREFARTHPSRLPLEVLDDGSTREEDRLGAIGDLALALRQRPLDRLPLLVAAGDNLIEFDLAPHAARFAAASRPLLLIRETCGDGASAYNSVELGAEERVLRFREKPQGPGAGLAAIAIYFFPPGLGRWVERYLAEGGVADAPGHLIAWLVERTAVDASRITGGWFDVGTPETLERARAAVRS